MTFDTDEQLLDAMDRLVTDPDLGRKLGEQGYAALHQRWTADVHIPRYLSLVKGVLEARNARVDEAHSPSPVAQG